MADQKEKQASVEQRCIDDLMLFLSMRLSEYSKFGKTYGNNNKITIDIDKAIEHIRRRRELQRQACIPVMDGFEQKTLDEQWEDWNFGEEFKELYPDKSVK